MNRVTNHRRPSRRFTCAGDYPERTRRHAAAGTVLDDSAFYPFGDERAVVFSSGKLSWYGAGSDPLAESDAAGNFTDEYIFFGGKRSARWIEEYNHDRPHRGVDNCTPREAFLAFADVLKNEALTV